MGFIETEERKNLEIEELKRVMFQLASCGRDDDDNMKRVPSSGQVVVDYGGDRVVCVTSGVSFLGLAVVDRLLSRGYSVRIIVDNEEDIEKLREMERRGEMRTSSTNNNENNNIKTVMAKMSDVESLVDAFQGCRGVFHTSAFTDPAGLSGYSKSMADIEVKASENVIKACARTPSVQNCVFTSSLVACIWRDGTTRDRSPVINHQSWSDESYCIDKKLWYALGKSRAEKAAWRLAKENGLKMAVICPGLITGPNFFNRNQTATIAYLKGAQEMFADGLLATIDVKKVAMAHSCVFEAMNNNIASGRYICFDRVVDGENEAARLADQVGMPVNKIVGNAVDYIPARFELSNGKLTVLMSGTLRTCYYQS